MRRFLLAALAVLSCQALAATPQQVIEDFSRGYRQLGISLPLSYREHIANLERDTDIAAQRRFFQQMQTAVASLDTSQADACQRLDLRRIGVESALHLYKLEMLARHRAAHEAIGADGLSSMPLGRDWYRYFLKRWLTLDVTPEQLMAMGRRELAAAQARYRTIQARMGYAGRDTEFARYLDGDDFLFAPGATPQAEYEARQQTVFANLDRIFPAAGTVPAQVAAANRGPAFPADAYYDSAQRTFYYNNAKPRYDRRSLDWLLLHESTPGHHYQSHYTEHSAACPQRLPAIFYGAFSEGWGAYVEEYGKALSLYRTDADELGAVEWDLVRSIRVVLDVGINDEGWSREQARAYWREQLPMLPALAEREIQRVRDWPAQAIAYKQGAVFIRELREEARQRDGASFDLRAFHDAVLRHGSLPLSLLRGAVFGTENEIGAIHARIAPDPKTKTVIGSTRWHLRNPAGTLQIALHGMQALGVRYKGVPLLFAAQNDSLSVNLPGLEAEADLEVDHLAKSPQGVVFGPDYAYSLYFTCHWMLCDEAPGRKAAAELEVLAPAGADVVASGEPIDVHTLDDGRSAHLWRESVPHSGYLLAFAMGPMAKAGSAALPLYGIGSSSEELERLFAPSAAMHAFLRERAGIDLPRAAYRQVLVPESAAQEASSFSLIGRSELASRLTDPHEDWAILHEMAHQWWGNWITCRDWNDFWLNEGLTSFMVAAWKEQRWGAAAYAAELALFRQRWQYARERGYDKALNYAGDYPDLRTRRAIVYSKGALFFDALRRALGDKNFWDGLQRYTRANAGRSVTTADFKLAMEAAAGRKLDTEFAPWLLP